MPSPLMAAALALGLVSAPAAARPHHHPHHHSHHHHQHDRRHVVSGHAGAIAGRPAACAGIPWCGCWLRLRFGIADARLNLARAWASVGSAASGPAAGVVVVWRHHVGVITENLGNGLIRVLSGNDGHAVRNRVRTTRGIIAYRNI